MPEKPSAIHRNVDLIRRQFPSLSRSSAVYFDNPGGTQIVNRSVERINKYLLETNANHGGRFETSRRSDEILHEAHAAMADFLNAAHPEEIIFGNNMTTLTLHLSRSLARTLEPGDEILVTRLDHDANISPWLLAARDKGCKVRWVDFHVEDGTLDVDDFARALAGRPKIAAFGYASNAIGTINPVRQLTRMAKETGALVFIDAVQYAPHGPIDVRDLGCDFLVCSSYKFFGPHAGVLYGKRDILTQLEPYKVRPAPNELPHRFETGTQNHEGIAGVLGAIEYFEWFGNEFGKDFRDSYEQAGFSGRRLRLKQAMTAIKEYEIDLSRALIETIRSVKGARIYGLSSPAMLQERVPTVSFTAEGKRPEHLAGKLGDLGVYVWHGHYYAIAVVERLGLLDQGGMIRVGAVHYNTTGEIERLGEALQGIA